MSENHISAWFYFGVNLVKISFSQHVSVSNIFVDILKNNQKENEKKLWTRRASNFKKVIEIRVGRNSLGQSL